MKTITTRNMLDRLANCNDPGRLEWYSDPAHVREGRPAGGGHLSWWVQVKGFQGRGFFAVDDCGGRPENAARGWAQEIRRQAALKLESLAVMA